MISNLLSMTPTNTATTIRVDMGKKNHTSAPTLKKRPTLEAQQELVSHMTEEVHMMREILANMHEEQEAHLSDSKKELIAIMQRRNDLFTNLLEIRYRRFASMQKLVKLLSNGKIELLSEKEGLEALLSSDSDEACEILSLRDQMVALIEKINEQSRSNQDLAKYPHSQQMPDALLKKEESKAVKPKKVLLEDET